MPVQALVYHAKSGNQNEGKDHKIKTNYRVGNKRIESLVGKIVGIIKRVSLLPPGWKG